MAFLELGEQDRWGKRDTKAVYMLIIFPPGLSSTLLKAEYFCTLILKIAQTEDMKIQGNSRSNMSRSE